MAWMALFGMDGLLGIVGWRSIGWGSGGAYAETVTLHLPVKDFIDFLRRAAAALHLLRKGGSLAAQGDGSPAPTSATGAH